MADISTWPAHMKNDTSIIWMYCRRMGDKSWIMRGIEYQETDDQGMYEGHQLMSAFELHVKKSQLIVLHHPSVMKQHRKFLGLVRESLEKTFKILHEEY